VNLTGIAVLLYSEIEMKERSEPKGRRRAAMALERVRERLAGAEDGWLFAEIADQVASNRRARGLSQAELAALCGTTQSAIARLESGGRPPRIDTLLRIANALDCELVVELRPRTTRKGGTS
jgi:ribosome-binding protein aMBF1 (putative translation factor)